MTLLVASPVPSPTYSSSKSAIVVVLTDVREREYRWAVPCSVFRGRRQSGPMPFIILNGWNLGISLGFVLVNFVFWWSFGRVQRPVSHRTKRTNMTIPVGLEVSSTTKLYMLASRCVEVGTWEQLATMRSLPQIM